jgi:hypothetical protein
MHGGQCDEGFTGLDHYEEDDSDEFGGTEIYSHGALDQKSAKAAVVNNHPLPTNPEPTTSPAKCTCYACHQSGLL